MYVKNYIIPTEELTTVEVNELIEDALKKFEKGNFLSLPVMDGEKLVGILHKDTIYKAYYDWNCTDKNKFSNKKVSDFNEQRYEKISINSNIEEASYALGALSIPFLAVFDESEKFVGILTHKAIFDAFSEVFGINKGKRVVVHIFDIPGQISRLAEVIRGKHINILSMIVVDAKVMGLLKVILRLDVNDDQSEEILKTMADSGFRVGEM